MASLKQRIKQFRLIIYLLIVVILVLIGVIVFMRPSVETLPSEAVEIAKIRDVEQIVSVDGVISGFRERELYFPSQSEITNLNVKVGQRVSKDEVLAEAESVSLTGKTEEHELVAPIGGIITAVNYNNGDTVINAAVPVIKIVNDSKYQINLDVSENDIVNIKNGQTATLTIPAISFEDEYKGEVIFVSPAAMSSSGAITYEVQIRPDALPGKIRLGMSADVDILVNKAENVLSIPESFLIEKDDKYFVKTVSYPEDAEKYQLDEVEVKIGLRTDTYVEITEGIEEGEGIVDPSFTTQRNRSFLPF